MLSRLRYRYLYILAAALVAYMPLHVFVAQSASLLTGGIEVWKAAKDVLVFLLALPLLYTSWRQGLWKDRYFIAILVLGLVYGLIHGVFLVVDQSDHTNTTIIASVYNTRLLIYLLLGYIVGFVYGGRVFMQKLFWLATVVASGVALFGVLQYFVLPDNFLSLFGYSLDRGAKVMFFIDDKPDFPRVMSTLKDPNSLGSFLIVPTLAVGYSLLSSGGAEKVFGRKIDKRVLLVFLIVLLLCQIVTFSRGALIGLVLSVGVCVFFAGFSNRLSLKSLPKKYVLAAISVVVAGLIALPFVWQTYVFQNIVFHADQSTVLADPNELRVQLVQDALADVADQPLGHGPGTAGLIAIRNPQGGVLTENYYLQIAYEVGWLGVTLFVSILSLIIWRLYSIFRRNEAQAVILLSAGVGYLFYSFLIHLWSNEAVALQWWLLVGVVIGHHAQTHPRLQG